MCKFASLRVEILKSGRCSVYAVIEMIVHFGCVGGTLKCSFVCWFGLFSLLVGSDFSWRHIWTKFLSLCSDEDNWFSSTPFKNARMVNASACVNVTSSKYSWLSCGHCLTTDCRCYQASQLSRETLAAARKGTGTSVRLHDHAFSKGVVAPLAMTESPALRRHFIFPKSLLCRWCMRSSC